MDLSARLGTGAAIAAACFVILWPAQTTGTLAPLNSAVEDALARLETTVEHEATCKNGQCQFATGRSSFRSCVIVNSNETGNGTCTARGSRLPWNGNPSKLGEGSASTAVTLAAVTVILLSRAWRSAVVVGAVGLIGGLLVDPLKYDIVLFGRPPYPSGHTAGASLAWGLLLIGVTLVLHRRGLVPASSMRWVFVAWGAVAFTVGFDRLTTGAHVLSDVLLAWSYSAALVLAAASIDTLWHARTSAPEAA